jgi:hypothetical protein
MKDALMRKLLLAEIIRMLSADNEIVSKADATQLVRNYLSKAIEFDDVLTFEHLVRELTDLLILYTSSSHDRYGEKLEKSLYKAANLKDETRRLPVLFRAGEHLVVRIPDVPEDNKGLEDNLVTILGFTLNLLGMTKDQLRITRDPTLGTSFMFPAKLSRTINILNASLRLPANQAGEYTTFETGLKANLPEMLATLRVVRRNSGLTRTVGFGKAKKSTVTSPDVIRKTFNIRSGMEEPGSNGWVAWLLKSLFSEVTKPDFEKFPGEWMHSLRVRNDCNSDTAIMAKLGYTPVHIMPSKVKKSLLTKVSTEKVFSQTIGKKNDVVLGKGTEKDVDKLKPVNENNFTEGLSFREFRAAVCCLLPFLDPQDRSPIQEQLPANCLKPVSVHTLEFFKKNSEMVDACNLAFAISSAIEKKSRKATPAQYDQARNHFINETANVNFQDRTGRKYDKFSDLPPEYIGWFQKNFYRKTIDKSQDSANNAESSVEREGAPEAPALQKE